MHSIKSVSQIAFVATCLMAILCNTHARSADGFGRMGRILASLKSDAVTPLRGFEGEASHPLEKRQIYDSSCKGVYDRAIWNELSHVCEDCDNLYREFGFQEKCKRGCFASELFVTCLYALGKDVEIFQDMAASLRGS
nr:hyperglycemic hormone [Callinectes toxotes]